MKFRFCVAAASLLFLGLAFEPATKDGKSVPIAINVGASFHLY
jgi:hypothetical protein